MIRNELVSDRLLGTILNDIKFNSDILHLLGNSICPHSIVILKLSSSASSTVFGHLIPNLWVYLRYNWVLLFLTRMMITSHFFIVCSIHELKPGLWSIPIDALYSAIPRGCNSFTSESSHEMELSSIDNIETILGQYVVSTLYHFGQHSTDFHRILLCINKAHNQEVLFPSILHWAYIACAMALAISISPCHQEISNHIGMYPGLGCLISAQQGCHCGLAFVHLQYQVPSHSYKEAAYRLVYILIAYLRCNLLIYVWEFSFWSSSTYGKYSCISGIPTSSSLPHVSYAPKHSSIVSLKEFIFYCTCGSAICQYLLLYYFAFLPEYLSSCSWTQTYCKSKKILWP